MGLLIDECLSTGLVAVAHELGYEAHHVAHLAKAGTLDPHLLLLILERDFTLVTNNATDFRKLYQRIELHAGLILILDQLTRNEQRRMFREVLSHLAGYDLVNKLVEVTSDRDRVAIAIFDLP